MPQLITWLSIMFALPVLLLLLLRVTSGSGAALAPAHDMQEPPHVPPSRHERAFSGVDSDAVASIGASGHFLQLTDLHLDVHYVEGSAIGTTCHRRESTPTQPSPHLDRRGKHDAQEKRHGGQGRKHDGHEKKHDQQALSVDGILAGPLGHKHCDSSMALIEETLAAARHLVDEQGVDFILWTGDNARHDEDKELRRTFDEIMHANRVVADKLLQAFGDTIPIIPSIGNNDIYPHNVFTRDSRRAVLNGLANAWSRFLQPSRDSTFATMDDAEAVLVQSSYDSFRADGYFFRRISSTMSVISVNTLLFFASNDEAANSCSMLFSPARKHIEWLHSVMASLERVGERTGYRQRVVFSGHIAPAHFLYTPSCYEAYHEIARRYAPMIVMHTFGHTNFDYFDLVREPRRYRDHETHAAAGLLLTAPPVVPYWNHATFRVYDYDVRQLLDYRQYHADLDRGNVERKLTFQLSYSFRDAYGVASMSPDEMHRVRQSLITNVTMSTEFLERMLGQDRGWVDRILGHVHDPEETWRFKKKWRKAMTLFCDRIDIDSADDDCRRMFYPNETATTVPESLTVTDLADEKHLMIDN